MAGVNINIIKRSFLFKFLILTNHFQVIEIESPLFCINIYDDGCTYLEKWKQIKQMVKLNTLLKKRAVIYWKYIILIAKKAASYSGADSFSKNYIIYQFWKWLSLVFKITIEYKIMMETWNWTPDLTLSNLLNSEINSEPCCS